MPVRLGKIGGNPYPLFPEGFEQMPADIRISVGMERAVLSGNFVIGILAVPHAEAIVMLRRKYQITDSCFGSGFRPLFRIETDGIKGFVQPEILFFKASAVSLPVDAGS